MFLVAMIAGIAHAAPDAKGTILFPLRPNLLIVLSIRKTTLLIYPVSSKMDMNRNKNAICGIKITIPPIPGIIPSLKRSVNNPAGRVSLISELILLKLSSMKSMGKLDQSKITWKIPSNMVKKIAYPQNL